MFKYVTLGKFSELSGYTAEAIRQKIKKGQWLEGVHFIKSPDGRIQIIPSKVEKWIEGVRQ